MAIIKPAKSKKRSVATDLVHQQRAIQKLSTQLELFLQRLTDARVLLEGIDRLMPLFDQIGLIEESLDECGGWIKDYLGGQMTYQACTKNLRKRAAPALLEELETLTYAGLDHEEQMEELVGILSFLDEDLLSSSCSSSEMDPGVIDSILDNDPMFPDESEATYETKGNSLSACYESSRRLLMDIELISVRLIEQIRTEGLLLQSAVIKITTAGTSISSGCP